MLMYAVCQGMSQSYASGDLTGAVSSPNMQVLSGNIPAGKEAVRHVRTTAPSSPHPQYTQQNIMTSEQCSSGSCPGFYRGTANVGWRDSKLFVVQFEMPPSGPDQPPAIWVLNGQIVRTAQYGCNCRGMGARGGCGELDVIEVLPEKPTVNAYSEIYSFKGTTGSGDDGHFARCGLPPHTPPHTRFVPLRVLYHNVPIRLCLCLHRGRRTLDNQLTLTQ